MKRDQNINKISLAETRFASGYASKCLEYGYNLTDEQKTNLVLKLYAKDEKRPLLKFKNLIRRETVKKMTADSLLHITEGVLSQKEALEHRKQVILLGLEKGDLKAVNTALDAFDSKLDLILPVVRQQISISAKTTDYRALLEGTQSSTEPPKQLSNDNTPPDEATDE